MAKLARVQVPPEMRRLAWLDEAPAQDSALAPERELELALAPEPEREREALG